MITLYVKDNCAYSAAVLAKLNALGVPFEQKNVGDPEVLDEVLMRGGKTQTPYMVDGETELYESADIVDYLEKTYGPHI
jgi:glutathione S-transferase